MHILVLKYSNDGYVCHDVLSGYQRCLISHSGAFSLVLDDLA